LRLCRSAVRKGYAFPSCASREIQEGVSRKARGFPHSKAAEPQRQCSIKFFQILTAHSLTRLLDKLMPCALDEHVFERWL
jgi:hypothetical protein